MLPSSPPTKFTGQVREVLEGGTLNLYVGMNVRRPGRYVLAARADEAGGKPFAYLSFNDVLREGPQEVKFPIFGKLVRDQNAASPFRLRDLEGFLLKEDADPDREVLVPRLGVVHVTRAYPESAFSDVEWDSEEKRRHLEEFEKDVREAENEVGSASGRR